MSNRFFISLLVVMAVIIGAFAFTKNNSNKTGGNNTQPTAHTLGSGQTVLIEYGDYQCPACYQYEPLVKQIREKYKDKITFQFRNFPITSSHPNAFAAARAAEAAAKQGKFWEMHDMLYEHAHQQTAQGITPIEWATASNPNTFFENYAKQLGLNVEQFKTDFASEEINDLVNADLAEAQKVPVTATPTFVLDGKKVEQSIGTFEDFSKLIDEAINKKTTANQ
jgi:protein-disulfide isomerase